MFCIWYEIFDICLHQQDNVSKVRVKDDVLSVSAVEEQTIVEQNSDDGTQSEDSSESLSGEVQVSDGNVKNDNAKEVSCIIVKWYKLFPYISSLFTVKF